MTIVLKKLQKQLLNKPRKEVSVEVNIINFSLLILNEAPYYSLKLDNFYIHLECFWRAIVNSKIVLTSEDENQNFGFTEACDIRKKFAQYFALKKIILIKIKNPIADLQVIFDDGSYLEAFASSSGYETWSVCGKNIEIVCLSDGGIGVF